MPRETDGPRRAALLDELIVAFSQGGIGSRSLRDVAAAVGTSHRMLLHHFGSREELLLSIVTEVERRQVSRFTEHPRDTRGAVLAMWADVRRPELRPLERLFFECYARAAQGEVPFDQMVPGAVEGWLAQVEERVPGGANSPMARLCLAAIRGLLLDLVATGDEAGVDAAAACFADLVGRA